MNEIQVLILQYNLLKHYSVISIEFFALFFIVYANTKKKCENLIRTCMANISKQVCILDTGKINQ